MKSLPVHQTSLGAEEIFAEAVNARGHGPACATVAQRASRRLPKPCPASARGPEWSAYVAELLRNLQSSLRRHRLLKKLRYLLYPSRLLPADEQAIRRNDAGVVWL
jgi:hypothetical protein